MPENPLHTYTLERTYREGWGVSVCPIWAGEDENPECDRIAEIEVFVIRLHPDNGRLVGSAYCMQQGDSPNVPVENFRPLDDLRTDDTHDLRDRWFATEDEARAHARYTAARWANPSPWESFIQL